MNEIEKAIQVTTEVEIDWAELGRVFADQSSPKQAEFIVGFYEAVFDAQLAFIGSESVYGQERWEIAALVENLAYFIREGAS